MKGIHFLTGDSTSQECKWRKGMHSCELFRLYPYEHQEKKFRKPYRVVGWDEEYKSYICIRKDIPLLQQLALWLLYWSKKLTKDAGHGD